MSEPRFLVVDIECAPTRVFTWGIFSQYVIDRQIEAPGYMLCWAAKWLGEKKIHYFDIRGGKKRMLRRLAALLSKADAVIHFNGSCFDMPIIRSEMLEAGMPPLPKIPQIDLYRGVFRKMFRFISNKLAYLTKRLKVKLKHAAPEYELWVDCMNKDSKNYDRAWRKMRRYNMQDVVATESLYKKVLPWIENHPNRGLYFANQDRPTCRNCGSRKMDKNLLVRTATHIYQRYKCRDCGRYGPGRKAIHKTGPGVIR